MSEIRKELMAAAEMAPKRGESDADFLIRLQKAISEEISEDVWNGLSVPAQDWNNDAADAISAGKLIPDFPDAVKATEPEAAVTPGRRGRGAAAPAATPEVFKPKIGDEVTVETKRGKKSTGFVVDLDKEVIVINPNGSGGAEKDDEEFDLAAVTISPALKTEDAGTEEAPEEDLDPKVGDTVSVVTARDKTIAGNILELSDETIVLVDASGDEHELGRSRLKSLTVKVKNGGGTTKATEPEAAVTPGRRGRPPNPDKQPAAEKADGKIKRASNDGVSVGQRIKELVCDNMSMKVDDIGAKLKKEGLDFRPNTLTLVYSDAHKFLNILKERKMLK